MGVLQKKLKNILLISTEITYLGKTGSKIEHPSKLIGDVVKVQLGLKQETIQIRPQYQRSSSLEQPTYPDRYLIGLYFLRTS